MTETGGTILTPDVVEQSRAAGKRDRIRQALGDDVVVMVDELGFVTVRDPALPFPVLVEAEDIARAAGTVAYRQEGRVLALLARRLDKARTTYAEEQQAEREAARRQGLAYIERDGRGTE